MRTRAKKKIMEGQQLWRYRFSFRSATIVLCLLNVVAAFLLLQGFLSAAFSRNFFTSAQSNLDRHMKESEEIRLAMQPWELIKRVREIEQEVYAEAEAEAVEEKETKQNAAVDLSKRLKDLRSSNDGASLKALEEWRKGKIERARLRDLEKNGTATSQA